MSGATVEEAMERYASGDDRAFADVYDALKAPLYRLAARTVRDRALAEDVVQQTFLNLCRARGSYVKGSPVLPWAKKMTRNLALDALRGRARAGRWTREDMRDSHARPTPPDERLAAVEMAGSIRAALAGLPRSQKAVLELRAQGLSLLAMASMLGTTVIAVKLRIHRALLAIRVRLGPRRRKT